MAKVFKSANQVLNVPGLGQVHSGNLTDKIYEQLIKLSPNFEVYFEDKEIVKSKLKDNGKD